MKIVFDPTELMPPKNHPGSTPEFGVCGLYYEDETESLLFCGASDLMLKVRTPCEDQIEHIASTLNGFLERSRDTVESLEIEILTDRVILTGRSGEENLSYSFHAPEAKNER